MDPHDIPGLLIILLYFKIVYSQQLNTFNSQQGVPQFQGNLNNLNQFSVSNFNKNVRQSQNLQEFLDLENQRNSLPQMNLQSVDYQQNPSALNANMQLLAQSNPLISQGNIANMKLSASPPQVSPNSNGPKLSSGQGIYIDVPQNSGINSIPSSVPLPPSAVNNQPMYSLMTSPPQNTVSQQALLQNSIVKQSQLTESSNPSLNCQQNPKPMRLIAGEPVITSIQYEPAIYSSGISSIPNSPEGNKFTLSSMRFQPVSSSVQSLPVTSPVVNQPNYNSIQFPPTVTVSQNSPSFISPQYQPVVNSVPVASSINNQAVRATFLNQPVRSVQVQPTVEIQPEISAPVQASLPPMQPPLLSYILSQLDSSKTPKYSRNGGSKQGSKSSLKALLPLILDVIKERQAGCGCRNCGCTNNNSNEVSIQEPKIFDGYSNQKVYGPNDVIPISNNKKLVKDYESPRKVIQKNIRQNVINTESYEDSGEDDSDYDDDE